MITVSKHMLWAKIKVSFKSQIEWVQVAHKHLSIGMSNVSLALRYVCIESVTNDDSVKQTAEEAPCFYAYQANVRR